MRMSLIVGIAVALLLGLMGSVYVVREGQVGLVLNLGRVVRSEIGPGLHFKLPLVESARVFDQRFTANEFPPERSLTSERKDVSVDFIAIVSSSTLRISTAPPAATRGRHRPPGADHQGIAPARTDSRGSSRRRGVRAAPAAASPRRG